jgi:FPC/CPF motif-containing protein YcgG
LESDEVQEPIELYKGLVHYLNIYRNIPGKSASIIFVHSNGQENLDDYRTTFWKILQGLHDVDVIPWPRHIPTNPENPHWEYCLGGAPWFITGHSPMHHQRKSRYSEDGLMMVMQPTANLHGIVGEGVVPEQIRQEIRGLLKKYDSIEESPDLWHPNDPAVLEWKQYWFNDTNERNMGQCPLKIRSQVEEELRV